MQLVSIAIVLNSLIEGFMAAVLEKIACGDIINCGVQFIIQILDSDLNLFFGWDKD